MIKATPNYIAIRIEQLLAHMLNVRLALGYDENSAKGHVEFSKYRIDRIEPAEKYTIHHLHYAKRVAKLNIYDAIMTRPNSEASTKTYKDKEFAHLFKVAPSESILEAERLDMSNPNKYKSQK